VILRTLREWEYLTVADDGAAEAIPRLAADRLVAAARASGLGGADGEAVLVNGHRRLRAQQVVGVLAAEGATLEILPKIDGLDAGATRHRLVHMLARVWDLEVASGALTDLSWQRHDLLEIVVRLFCDTLIEAVRRGLPRRYVPEEADRSVLRGRLDVQRQFTVLAATPHRLACRFEELSPDIALNQIIRAAVVRLRGIAKAPENQRRLAELSFAFADITPVVSSQLPWDRVVLDRTNATWANLLKLARLILGERFQTTSSGQAMGHALLFEMNTLFEEYVGRMLRRALAGTQFKVRLQGPQDYALEADDGARRFMTKPDIVIMHQDRPILIVDTKWKRLAGQVDDAKRGVSQGDVYQMMAYSQVYGCPRVLLLYPHHGGVGGDEGIQASHLIRGGEDRRLALATVGLTDFAGIEARLRKIVVSQLGGDWQAAAAA
jgi:5-methylcytosine-specific restriction enzyme subunit McrC